MTGALHVLLTHLSLSSFLWDIGKQNSPRCDAAERGVPSGVILFAKRIFIKNLFKKLKITHDAPRNESGHPNDNNGKIHSSNMG